MKNNYIKIVVHHHSVQFFRTIMFGAFFALLFLFIPSHSLGLTPVSGQIASDTTWTVANSPYYVVDDVTVALGAKLTIEPGTVVKFAKRRAGSGYEEVKLIIQGALWAQGTADNKIYFTSIDDPTVGGVTGDATPDSTDWGWIEFQALSKNASSLLEYCVLKYGGNEHYSEWSVNSYVARRNDTYVIKIQDASPTIRNSEFFQCRGGIYSAGTTAIIPNQTIVNNVFTGCATTSIQLASGVSGTVQGNTISGGGSGIVLGSGVSGTIQGNTVSGMSSWALSFAGNNAVSVNSNTLSNNGGGAYWGAGGTGTFNGNTLQGNTQSCQVDADFSVSSSGNQVTGSGFNGLTVFGGIEVDTTWSPSRLTAMGLQPVYYVVDDVTVALGAKLTIEPGTVVKFAKRRAGSGYEEVKLIIQGALWAQGTADNKIYFTSIDDPTVGGVTGDATPDSTDWGWIEFQALSKNASSLLEYCVLKYGGNEHYSEWSVNSYVARRNDTYVIKIQDASPTIRNSEFFQCRGGIYSAGTTAIIPNQTIVNNVFTGCATTSIQLASGVSGTVQGNTISGGGSGIVLGSGVSGTIQGNTVSGMSSWALSFAGNNAVSVNSNTLSNNGGGAYWGAGGTGTFNGNTLQGNTQSCQVDADFSVSSSGNQVTGSGFNGLTVFGGIEVDTTWSPSRLTAMGLQPVYYVVDDVTVALGAKLTIEPGTVVKFAKRRAGSGYEEVKLIIQGALWAQGTADNKIYFTSIDDPTVGGVTGDATPDSTDWGWIEFQALSKNASSLLEYCVLKYGGNEHYSEWSVNSYVARRNDTYVIKIQDASPTIRNSEFFQCRGGIYVNNGSVDVYRSSFTSIATTGIYYELGSATDLNPVVVANTFTGVPISIRYAGGSSNSFGVIAGNEFTNATTAILVSRVGSGLTAYHNEFSNITSFAIQNTDATNTVSAQNNWWGSANGPAGAGGGTGVPVSQYVNFSDWWTASTQNTQGVWNVRAQRQGDTMLVDIFYDLIGVSSTKYCISLSVSNTGGEPYTINPSTTSLTGAIGCGVLTGNDLHILWDAAAVGGGNYTDRMRVKITANIE